MFRRNVGSPEEQRTQFPPHRIVGNLYYAGSRSLAAFLLATPEGHILINTNRETAARSGRCGAVSGYGGGHKSPGRPPPGNESALAESVIV